MAQATDGFYLPSPPGGEEQDKHENEVKSLSGCDTIFVTHYDKFLAEQRQEKLNALEVPAVKEAMSHSSNRKPHQGLPEIIPEKRQTSPKEQRMDKLPVSEFHVYRYRKRIKAFPDETLRMVYVRKDGAKKHELQDYPFNPE